MDTGCDCLCHKDALARAVNQNHPKCIREIMELFVPDKGEINLAFYSAIRFCYLECVRVLLECKVDPNASYMVGYSPIKLAVTIREEEIVKLLLNAKAKVEGLHLFESSIVTTGIFVFSENIMHMLLDAGVKPHRNTVMPRRDVYVKEYYLPHKRCKKNTKAFLGVLRKRYRVPSAAFPTNGYPLPLQLIQIMAKWIWSTRWDTEHWSE